jgi:hypothetical protein
MSTTESSTQPLDTANESSLFALSRLRWCSGDSEAIRAFAYRKATKTLFISFAGDGASERGYAYHGVTPYRARQFRHAASRGRYCATTIKPNYECTPFEVVVRETQLWQRKAAPATAS